MKVKVTDINASGYSGGTVKFLREDGSWAIPVGSVTSFGFNNANGITGTVTNPGTTPVLTLSIDAGSVANSRLADMSPGTFKGRQVGSTGAPQDLTGAMATALLNVFTPSLQGLVPAPGTATGKFLKDDGTWADVAALIGVWAPAVTGELPGPAIIADPFGQCMMIRIA